MRASIDAECLSSTLEDLEENYETQRRSVYFNTTESFETHATIENELLSLSTNVEGNLDNSLSSGTNKRLQMLQRKDDLRLSMIRQNSLLSGLIQVDIKDLKTSRFQMTKTMRFFVFFFVIPIIVSIWHAVAMFFPPEFRQKAPFLLWTDGALTQNKLGEYTICHTRSLCAEGLLELAWLLLSRCTAFATYALMGITFLSKMHCTINWLSVTHVSMIIPFENLHKVHTKTGLIYFILAMVHTFGHFVRWYLRYETIEQIYTQVTISGLVALISMSFVTIYMSPFMKNMLSFETKMNAHHLSLVMAIALCAHSRRCRNFTLIFVGLWCLDSIYGYLFKTHRLDVVEFTPLPCKAGVQMLWHNPRGFKVRSGEYVKIKLPWLSKGGDEWHAFSVYLNEATEQGIREIIKKKREKRDNMGLCAGYDNYFGKEVIAKTTALLLIEMQNEVANIGGKLYNSVKHELYRTDMVRKTVMLAEVARSAGAHVFHLPLNTDERGDHSNRNVGVLNELHEKKLFVRDTWNTEIINEHKPRDSDVVVKGKNSLDSFYGSNLQDLLQEKEIETLIIGGLLTNGSVESTMRTAYEKGYHVITLIDGTACCSEEHHIAATEGSFNMFSSPMTCQNAAMKLLGNVSATSGNLSMTPQVSTYSQPEITLNAFAELVLTRKDGKYNPTDPSLINEEARKDLHSQYETTQVFITPAGDWTNRVVKELTDRNQLRSCWVRGPFTSPFSVASDFNHTVLVATGIGVTPALGVMGQYSGSARSKFLVWVVKCPYMLKFFAPLLKDAHIAAVYYTGKDHTLSEDELMALRSYGNIYIKQERPSDLTTVVESLIETYENQSYKLMRQTQGISDKKSIIVSQITVDTMDEESLRGWCVLYCGGSRIVKDMLHNYAEDKGITFNSEMFDW